MQQLFGGGQKSTLQKDTGAPAKRGHFSIFPKTPLTGERASCALRHPELHPHPSQPLAVGEKQLDELSPSSLCIYLFILLLPAKGLSKRSLFIFGKGKTTSRNWYESDQPQMVNFFVSIPIPKLQLLGDKPLLANLPPSSSLSLYFGINVPQEGRFV